MHPRHISSNLACPFEYHDSHIRCLSHDRHLATLCKTSHSSLSGSFPCLRQVASSCPEWWGRTAHFSTWLLSPQLLSSHIIFSSVIQSTRTAVLARLGQQCHRRRSTGLRVYSPCWERILAPIGLLFAPIIELRCASAAPTSNLAVPHLKALYNTNLSKQFRSGDPIRKPGLGFAGNRHPPLINQSSLSVDVKR